MAYYCGGELYHYGVMGMHWGIRRYQPYPAGHTGGKEVGQAAKIKKKKYVYPSADINSMSNDQLRRKVNRMRLESRYADMSTQKYVAERKAQKAADSASKSLNNFKTQKAKSVLDYSEKIPDKMREMTDTKYAKKFLTDKQRADLVKVTRKVDKARNTAYVNLGLDEIDSDNSIKSKDKKEAKSKRLANTVQSVGGGIKGANDIVKSAQRINRVDYRNEKMYEATKMSYKELQEKVNRMDMERQYSELKKSAYTTKGKQALEELWPILVATGAVATGAKSIGAISGATDTIKYLSGR